MQLSERPRRLRSSTAMRRLVGQTRLDPAQLVLPVFVRESASTPVPIGSMPGVLGHTQDSLRQAVTGAAEAGVGGVMVFAVPSQRDPVGSAALDPEGILSRSIRAIVSEVGDTVVVMADLCLDEFTDHGHCGVLRPDGVVDNDATLVQYQRMSEVLAGAGAQMLGTSGMMDGQVGAVREALDAAGFQDTSILAYAAKHASALYGPFREAVASTLAGDRRTYQQDVGNAVESLREVRLDLAQGADVIMVKPALTNLDTIAAVAARVDLPVAAYQVSGEMAMVEAAARQGWIDRDATIAETLIAIRRSGASIILTYWATEVAHWLRSGRLDQVRGYGDRRGASGVSGPVGEAALEAATEGSPLPGEGAVR